MSKNLLNQEKSTYLLQHQNNPVHWHPYSSTTIELAKKENKPIFLSIGYSSCHWCHVMAHESFEDQTTADILNKNFINIKVDREEFPDLDAYYQKACQLFIQRGGWPLSAFLTPDMKPFYVGTYFPKNSSDGIPSFTQLLHELLRVYNNEKEKILENSNQAVSIIEKHSHLSPEDEKNIPEQFPSPRGIINALKDFQDNTNGGFGKAPKFPNFAFWEWAVEQMIDGQIPKGEADHIFMSLENILMGGIFDHLRGGIHRYSTDEKWLVPHFEKMLYDQAGFLKTFSKLSLIYPSPIVLDAIFLTLDYLEKEMLSDEQFFLSAQDADSEGEEGIYFTFTLEEFEDCIKNCQEEKLKSHIDQLKIWFDISEKGNFETGLNVISLNKNLKKEIIKEENWELIRLAKKVLLEERKQRIPPITDTKGIASWNFMLCSSLIDVAQYCPVVTIRNMAIRLFDLSYKKIIEVFLTTTGKSITNKVEGQKEVTIRHCTTKLQTLPYAEDYIFFAESLMRGYEITGQPHFFSKAKETIEFIIKEYLDQGQIFTRPVSLKKPEPYGNLALDSFDSSHRSPLATLIHLTRRVAVCDKNMPLLSKLSAIQERLHKESLRNPIGCGEALRALTYPLAAYKVLEIPRNWLADENFINFKKFLMPRFILSFHERDADSWQICGIDQCDFQGKTVADLIKILSPKNETT